MIFLGPAASVVDVALLAIKTAAQIGMKPGPAMIRRMEQHPILIRDRLAAEAMRDLVEGRP